MLIEPDVLCSRGHVRVLIVYKQDYPWDIRVEKIAESLSDRGHQVTVLARNRSRIPRQSLVGRVQVRRTSALPRWLGELNVIWNLPHFANPNWLLALWVLLLRHRFDLVMVRDIPLILAVLPLARLAGARVMLDMAECYPEMYRELISLSDRPWALRLIKNPWLARLLERIAVDHCDQTLTVVEEARQRLLTLGHDAGRIDVVSNTPRTVPESKDRHRQPSGPLRLVYLGNVERFRGIEQVLRAIALTKRNGSSLQVQFSIIGGGPAVDELKRLARETEIDRFVVFHGWLDRVQARSVMGESDVGIIPHIICEAWHRTIPNKLFDYMAHGLPVLSSDCVPVRRVVEECDCGLLFSDTQSLVRALEKMADPVLRAQLGKNGRRCVAERYRWEVEEAVLFRVVEDGESA